MPLDIKGIAQKIGNKIDVGKIATNALSGLSSGILDLMFGGKAAERNAEINYRYNEMAAEAADRRQRALYEDFLSPASRIQQLREAGLSPSLYAEGAGAGSQGVATAAQGSGASGVGIPTVNLAEMAQVRLANAQADKAEAEASTLKGENERGRGEIANLWADLGATEAAEAYTRTQNNIAKIDLYVSEKTKEFSITRARYECEKAMDSARQAYWEAEDAGLTYHYNQATYESRIEEQANKAVELAARIALEHSQTELNGEEKRAIKQYIVQGYTNLAIQANSSEAYSKYVEAYADNLPRQLELRSKEIGLEKWKIGVDAFNNLVRTIGYVAGATQLGDGGYMYEEEINEPSAGSEKHMRTTKTKSVTKTRLPKRF